MLDIYKKLLLPVYLPSLISSSVHTSTIILLPVYLLESGHGVAVASFAVALRGLGVLLADIPAGLIANRYGDKAAMVIGSLCLLTAIILLTLSDTLIIIYIAAVFTGFSNAMNMIGRLSYITDVTENYERGRAISIMAGLQRCGSLLGPLCFSFVAKVASYQLAFSIMLVMVIFNVIAVVLLTKSISSHHRKESPFSAMFHVLVDFRKVLLTAGYGGLTLMMLRAARNLFFSLFGYEYGLDVAQIGLLYSISSGVDMIMFYPAGKIMDAYGRKWTAVPGTIILAISLIILPLIPSYWGLVTFALLSGLGNGITSGVLLTIGSDFAPRAERNQFLGLWRLQSDIGMALAPFVVGMLAESVSLLVAAWCISGFGFTGAAMLGIFVKETLNKNKMEKQTD